MADLNISKGGHFEASFLWEDDSGNIIDIAGYTACLNIRPGADSDVILHQATDGNGLTITGNQGEIALEIPASVTKDFGFVDAVTDLRLTDTNGKVVYFPVMKVRLERTVSRECS